MKETQLVAPGRQKLGLVFPSLSNIWNMQIHCVKIYVSYVYYGLVSPIWFSMLPNMQSDSYRAS